MYALLEWDEILRTGTTVDLWCRYLFSRKQISDEYFARRNHICELYSNGTISHDQAVSESNIAYGNMLKGMDAKTYTMLANDFVRGQMNNNMVFTEVITEWMNRNNVQGYVISGSPIRIIGQYFTKLGIVAGIALEEYESNGILTGEIKTDGGYNKKVPVKFLKKMFGYPPVLAVGNSESDIPMLDSAMNRIIVGDNHILEERYPDAVFINHRMTREEIELALTGIILADNRLSAS